MRLMADSDSVAQAPVAQSQGGIMPNHQPKLSKRIEKRLKKIKADHEHLPRLLEDLKGSLDVVRCKAPMLC